MRIQNLFVSVLIIFVLISGIFAQQDKTKDQTLRGSGRVNPSTLAMEFDLPLGNYQGRGINLPISVSYSSKVWRMEYTHSMPRVNNPESCISINSARFAEDSASGWTNSLAVPYIEYSGKSNIFLDNGFPFSVQQCDPSLPTEYHNNAFIKRINIHLPSGETHELRASEAPLAYPSYSNCLDNDPNTPCDPNDPSLQYHWNTTFYAVDGSNIKYIEDSNSNTYKLLMPDGSYYEFAGSLTSINNKSARKAVKFTDRNGNFTTYNNSTGVWTDTLGRTFSAPFGINAPEEATTQTYAMPGMSGTYKFVWKQLKGNSATTSGLVNFNQNLRYKGSKYVTSTTNGTPYWADRPENTFLFGSEWEAYVISGELFNPIVLAEIELPTGEKYKFGYNITGQIEKIKYPTGGEEQFVYAQVAPLAISDPGNVSDQTNFGVISRKVLKFNEDTTPYEWTYNAYHVDPMGYKITINNPDGTKAERFLHQGNSSTASSTIGSFGYDNGLAGMAYEERGFDSAGNIASRNLKRWIISSIPVLGSSQSADLHPRVVHEENYIYDSSGSGVYSTVKYEYEGDLGQRETPVLQKKAIQYGFIAIEGSNSLSPIDPGDDPEPVPTPVPTPVPPTLVRSSETTFLINDVAITNRQSYKDRNMVGLATASIIKDAAGNVVSRSEMKYDESGYSPNDYVRGNPTTSRVWDSTKGSYSSAGSYISTHAKFDTWGNQIESTDAKGNTTVTQYDATHHAYPIKVITPIPDPTGQRGSNTAFETTATFNSITGLPLTTTDANGQTTTMEYDPVTLRPIRVIPPVGAGVAETIYHDEPNNYWVKNRSQIDANNWEESITYFDGLGRAYKSEEVNSKGNIFVEKEFDSDGRVKRVTNPFRAGEAKVWTTNVYDEASRVKEVILQDGAKIKTDYGVSTSGIVGVTKQITDQAGKKRKGFSDALGRMVRVVEDPDGQNLATDYQFDTLGNLRKTIQGEQLRYFTYDSLGRLRYAKQPEQDANTNFNFTDPTTNNPQWSTKYEYDDNGNIISTTDARGVTVSGVYDSFNRLTDREYSDATPDVDFYYDGKGLPSVPNFSKGKTTRVFSSVSETQYKSFDNLGKLLTHSQITDGQTYSTSYQYDAFGTLKSETYPSGRTVNFEFNQDGDISRIGGTVGLQNRIYANGISYNSAGSIERIRLGNGKWETAKYNTRQQITEIGLGSSATDKSLLKLEYDYGTNLQNNGSMRSQKISFNGLANPFEQTYAYDDLNRLLSAEEKINNATTWKQTFQYDRYGNRRFDAGQTTTLSISNNVTNPEISTANNRFSANQNYSYDPTGNLTQDAAGNQFFYDAENHQKEIKNASNQVVGEYLYDGEGKRVKKKSNTETTIFVYNGTGSLVAEYSTNVVPAAEAKISYLTQDHLGSPRIMTDDKGQVIARKDFGAFGDETFTAQRTEPLGYKPENIRQDYTGYQRDDESGLEFAQARYYNAAHGRFTSIDPLTASANVKDPQTFNRYTYAMNSPYKFTDSLGLISSSTSASGRNSECEQQCQCCCQHAK